MLRESVQSSNLRSVGYDELQQIVEIEFHGGGIYQYSNVPSEVHSGLMDASSKGKFFAQFIRDRFHTRRVG